MFPRVFRTSKNFTSHIPHRRLSHSATRQNVFPFARTKQNSSNICVCFVTQYNSFSSKSMKVAVLGAASKTGNCLSLFLKQSPLIDELAIYDTKCTYGVAVDLNYIDTRCKVSTCDSSEECLRQTLEAAKIVVIVADRDIKKKSNPDEILKRNADTLSDLLPYVIKFCPRAMVAVAMSPINSLIPLATEMYKKAGVYEYNRLFGVISLDCVRANTLAAEAIGIEPECTIVPVIGGNSPETCVPVFSRAKPCNQMSSVKYNAYTIHDALLLLETAGLIDRSNDQQEAYRLTQSVRSCDEAVSKMTKDKEAAWFAMSFAAARFCVSLCKALRHQRGVVECAYVRSCVIPELTYFAAPLELGPDGIQKHLGIPPLNAYECKLLGAAVPVLKRAIAMGEALALGHDDISSEVCLQRSESQATSSPS